MVTTIEVVYEGGVLRPLAPIALDEGAHIEVLIISELAESRDLEDVLDRIAAMPIEGKTDPFSGEDHDRALYGEDRGS